MTGSRQIDEYLKVLANHPELIPADRFVRLDTGRVACVLCHREGTSRALVGMPDLDTRFRERGQRAWHAYFPWSPWQISCLMDHSWPCTCGRTYTSFNSLWRHVGAVRPNGWGRQGVHEYALACEVAS